MLLSILLGTDINQIEMKKLVYQTIDPDLLLDCSQEDQINFWAEIFQVTPAAIKTAVRACCNNSIACISAYLKNSAKPASQYQQKHLQAH
jgi:hypothetical protein